MLPCKVLAMISPRLNGFSRLRLLSGQFIAPISLWSHKAVILGLIKHLSRCGFGLQVGSILSPGCPMNCWLQHITCQENVFTVERRRPPGARLRIPHRNAFFPWCSERVCFQSIWRWQHKLIPTQQRWTRHTGRFSVVVIPAVVSWLVTGERFSLWNYCRCWFPSASFYRNIIRGDTCERCSLSCLENWSFRLM